MHLSLEITDVSVNDNYSALRVRYGKNIGEKMSEKYSVRNLSLAFYVDADGVSLRRYKCQTRLIWIPRKTGEEGTGHKI